MKIEDINIYKSSVSKTLVCSDSKIFYPKNYLKTILRVTEYSFNATFPCNINFSRNSDGCEFLL